MLLALRSTDKPHQHEAGGVRSARMRALAYMHSSREPGFDLNLNSRQYQDEYNGLG